jgi:hypothetical protein
VLASNVTAIFHPLSSVIAHGHGVVPASVAEAFKPESLLQGKLTL